jgi:putative transcriptional regulator
MLKKWMGYALCSVVAAWSAAVAQATELAQAADDETAVFLVATTRLVDPSYRQTVLLVVPTDNDRHIGFIINRPTKRTLSSLFPDHEPSKKVADPVYFGGPMSRSALFAVVKSANNPGGGSVKLMKDLFFSMRVDVVDRIIERSPNEARYYVGYVEWRPGELRYEINRGLWHVMNPDMGTVFRKDTDSLWEELIKMTRAVTADARKPELPAVFVN